MVETPSGTATRNLGWRLAGWPIVREAGGHFALTFFLMMPANARRISILPKQKVQQAAIAWHSWVYLVTMLAAMSVVFWYAHGLVLAAWLRGTLSALWIATGVTLGILDFATHTLDAKVDSVPVDRWTIVHTGAGVVFGVWYLPLWAILLITVAWEGFEILVVGFGERETLANRAVDVGVALAAWLLVVLVAMGTTEPGAPFPLLHSELARTAP